MWVHTGARSGRRVYSDSRGLTNGSLGSFGFAWIRSGVLRCRFHSGSLGFTQCALGSPGSFRFAWGHSGAPRDGWVHSGAPICHSGLLGFTLARLVVARFIRFRSGSLWHAYWSPGSFGFTWVHTGARSGRRVHSRSPGFSRANLGVAGCIRVRVGSFSASPCRRVHSGSLVLNVWRLGVAGFIRVRLGQLIVPWVAGLIRIQLGSLVSLVITAFILVRLGSHSSPRGHQFHSHSLGFSLARLEVARFIQVCLGLFWRAKGSPDSLGFALGF